MSAIPADYGKLNTLVEKLGIIWEIDPESDPSLEEATIVLKTKPSEAHKHGRSSAPLDVGNAVDVLTFLFDVGLLTDVGQPAILQRLENLEKALALLDIGSAPAEAGPTLKDAEERAHYLQLFRKKKPEFEAIGIELSIDTENWRVRYRNPAQNRRPIYYDISQSGYGKATDALRALKKSREQS